MQKWKRIRAVILGEFKDIVSVRRQSRLAAFCHVKKEVSRMETKEENVKVSGK